MQSTTYRYHSPKILHVVSGSSTTSQLEQAIKQAIPKAEKLLNRKIEIGFKVNLVSVAPYQMVKNGFKMMLNFLNKPSEDLRRYRLKEILDEVNQRKGSIKDQKTIQNIDQALNSVSQYLLYGKKFKDLQNKNLEELLSYINGKEQVPFGYGYVWIEDREFFNLLCGNNPDGSPREELEYHPSVMPATLDELKKEWDAYMAAGYTWADIQEEIESMTFTKKLDPLIELDSFTLNNNQKEQSKTIKPEFLLYNKQNRGLYRCSAANIKSCDSKFQHNVLVTKGVPEFVTERDIKNEFEKYSSSVTKVERRVRGQIIEDTYPTISINRGTCFVTFDPMTKDAQFSILMTRVLTFKKETTFRGKRKTDTHVLNFGLAYK